ncbi:TPA: RNA-guided endonuclease TnpB family protein [Clostridium perfringens]
MAKSKTPSYILTLRLKTEKYQEDIINKRFEIGRTIYNSVLGVALKRYRLMLESKDYNKVKRKLKNINNIYHNTDSKKEKKQYDKERKLLYKELEIIKGRFGLTNYSLYTDVKPMYKHFKNNIDSLMAQAIADRVWKSLDKLLNGEGTRCYFKRYREFNSLENKWDKSGMVYRDGLVKWNKLSLPVIIKPNDTYAQRAIQDRVKYCRIIRKEIKGKNRYYVQLVLEGIPPQKVNKNTGEVNSIGTGDVGIDIGTQTIAISSKYDVKLLELAPSINNIDRKIKLIQRKMDRSRRSMNPNKYNEDGTIKKGNKDKWIYSNKYLKLKSLRKELFRKQTIWRKQDHENLANYIISLGDNILVETMNFKGLQKRTKNTTINSKGKFNKKKRFGKSLANKAPSMLLEIIDRKLKYENLSLKKINTYKVKASQYNHFTDEFNKKELKDRWNNDIGIQRDMYSAFLIMNVNDDLESINRNKCIETYDNFKELHDREINRLKELKLNGFKLISSMGI